MNDSWTQVRALFDALMALPPGEREAQLAAADVPPAVRDEVRSLLLHQADESFLASAASVIAEPPMAPAPPLHEGQHLGPWCVQTRLGRGGMGDVWLARRADGAYDAQAAVKVLRADLDSAGVLARFAQEQRMLARLSHPHIARLYDAGRTDSGSPYFVMEYVQGQDIDKACAGLPLAERLALFLQLTDAVSHAHRQLLLHRDLKPSNVLVTPEGQVKLLDFGIAKALDPLESLTGDAHQTQAGERPFTPHFASPEQVRGEPVGTATDLYSLGVLLYLLLTGARPYGRDARTPHEAVRSVLEDEPSRPSTLSPGIANDPQWMANRERLRGDLDNIVLKALDKRIEQRYASVDALAADIRAHLGGFPVSARAATWRYRASRFIGRNRAAVAAAALAVVALMGGAALATWQAVVAAEQRQLAERRFNDVRQFARTMLIDVDTALRDGPTAGREKLVSTSLQYLDRLSAERLSDPELLRDLAEAYERVGDIQGNSEQANLGRPQDARMSLDKALALRQSLAVLAPDDQKNILGLLSIHERLGDTRRAAGDLKSAATHYTEATRHATRLAELKPDDLKLQLRRIEAERFLASVYYWPFNRSLGDHARARPMIEGLVQRMDTLLARNPQHKDVLENFGPLLNQLSDFQRLAGEFAASLSTQRKAHALAVDLAERHADNPRFQRWLYLTEGRVADALFETGAFDDGLAMWQRSIRRREDVARADPGNERAQRNLANGYGPLAEQLATLGRHAEALAWYERENQLLRTLRQRHPQVKALVARLDESDRDLAFTLFNVGKGPAAVALQRQLDERLGALEAPRDADDARFALLRARVLLGAAGNGLDAAQQQTLLQHAQAAVDVTVTAAAAEPFNALLAREAALAREQFALALPQGDARGCPLLQGASAELTRLATKGQLPATLATRPAQLRDSMARTRCVS